MSVTFQSDVAGEVTVTEPCLCAQMAEGFSAAVGGDLSPAVVEDLRASANEGCPHCQGSGVEAVTMTADYLNLSNEVAWLVLSALGLPVAGFGILEIADARRAVVRARNRDLSRFVVAPETVYEAPREANGVVELRPVRAHYAGVSRERLEDAVGRFAALVDRAVAAGAKGIRWA